MEQSTDIIKGFGFDDLLLFPQISRIKSGKDIDLSSTFTLATQDTVTLKLPFIASPMKEVVSEELIVALGKLGGIGILHRFMEFEEWHSILSTLDKIGMPYGAAIPYNSDWYQHITEFKNLKILSIDAKNGYELALHSYISLVAKFLVDKECSIGLMAGNIATESGARALYLSGTSLIRVGIGSGSLSTLRSDFGIGIPQLTALASSHLFNPSGLSRVSDGGIRTTGDMIKALASGANFLMLGSLFAQAKESFDKGVIYKGEKISLKDLLTKWYFNLLNGMIYLGAENLSEITRNARWISVQGNEV